MHTSFVIVRYFVFLRANGSIPIAQGYIYGPRVKGAYIVNLQEIHYIYFFYHWLDNLINRGGYRLMHVKKLSHTTICNTDVVIILVESSSLYSTHNIDVSSNRGTV